MITPRVSENRRMLTKINKVLEGKMDKDVQSFQINGRLLSKMPIQELLQLKEIYTQKCLTENGQVFSQVRFR